MGVPNGEGRVLVYGFLAEFVVLVHLAWIVFLIGGAVVGRRVRWVRRLHLAGLGFAMLLTAGGWICPLTYFEVWLREQGGGGGYRGTFLGHWAERLVYWEVPRWVVLLGVVMVAAVSMAAYGRKRTR